MITQAEIHTTEALRVAEQRRLDSLKDARERNRLGQFATPASLALEIARFVAALPECNQEPIRLLEPAVGTGSFYSALLDVFPASRIGSAIGIEIDQEVAAVARQLWAPQGLQVVAGNFFASIADIGRPNLILANPPYVRHHHLDTADKVALQRLAFTHTGLQVNGLAGLYVYFVLAASSLLAPGGIAAWLIPSEFMDVNYGAVIKRFLTEQVTLLRIHRYDPLEVQFDDALVTSAVVILKNVLPSREAIAEVSYGGILTRPERSERVSLACLAQTRKWTAFPTKSQAAVSTRAGRDTRIGDVFKIQRGIATGANDFFILPRAEASNLGLPDVCLHPILPSPRALRETIIEGNDDGYPDIAEQLVLIDCDLPEEAIQERYPALWHYLAQADIKDVRERYLVRKRTPWYKQEKRKPAPFLTTYMGRSTNGKSPFRFIWNRSQAVATNLFLLMYPTGALAAALQQDPTLERAVFDFLSAISAETLREENRVYGGGLHKIEPSELARIPADALVDRLGNGAMSAMAEQTALPFLT